MTGRVITLMSCKPECPVFASNLYVLETIVEICFETLPRDVFLCLQVSIEQIYYALAKKPDKLLWARLKEKTFAFMGNDWNRGRVERFCVFIVQNF